MLCPDCNLYWNVLGCALCGRCVAHKKTNYDGHHECDYQPKVMKFSEMVMRRLEGMSPED